MNHIKFFWKPIIWGMIVIILSTMNTNSINSPAFPNIPHLDKIVHFGLYLIFTFLLIVDIKRSGLADDSPAVIFFIASSAAVIFGGVMEILQLIPGLNRSACIYDFIFNMAGSITAVLLFNPVTRLWIILLKNRGK